MDIDQLQYFLESEYNQPVTRLRNEWVHETFHGLPVMTAEVATFEVGEPADTILESTPIIVLLFTAPRRRRWPRTR